MRGTSVMGKNTDWKGCGTNVAKFIDNVRMKMA